MPPPHHQQQQQPTNTTNNINTNSPTINSNLQQEINEQEQAANELLARVDLNAALEFVQNLNQPTKPQPTRTINNDHQRHLLPSSQEPQTPTHSTNYPSSLDLKTPTITPATQTPLPSELGQVNLQPDPTTSTTTATTSPSKNQRLKTISISILRTVARKRDFSSGQHSLTTPDSPAIQSLPPALQSILSDHHHHSNELSPTKRPSFIVDLRSVTAAAERHQANPNQIRRVEECKRFFSLRYEPIFTTLAEGKPPPSLVKVAEWRRKLQLVSILRQKREQSLRSTSQAATEPLPRPNNDQPSRAEELRLKLKTAIDQPSLLTPLPHQQNTYKWICLSSRKRRTMWEICPEDIQAFMSTQGLVEDEEELREAERLFGQFDQHPVRHHKSSRQRVNSSNKTSSRWFNDPHLSTSQLSDNDSTRSPHSGQASFHSQSRHLRKPSSGTSSSREIRANGSNPYPETSSGLPRISDFRYSSDMSSHNKYTRLQNSSDIDERDPKDPQADSSQANLDLLVDVHNLSWSGKTPVSSPHGSSAIPISPLERFNPRGSTTILPSSSVFPADYHTPPQSQTQSSSTAQQPSRHSSDHGPRPSKHALVKSKVKKYHSAWSATDESGNLPSGLSPLRSNSQPPIVNLEPALARQSKQRLSSLSRGLATNHPSPVHIASSPEKPNLSRAASAKGLLHFAKRSIIPDLPTGPSSFPLVTPRPPKLSFFHKPPRDWKGWKFDKSHLIFRNTSDKKPSSSDLFPPVNDILFVSPFHQPLRTPNHQSKTALYSLASQQTVSLPILITDLTDEEVQEIQKLIVILTTQLDHSETGIKESQQEYRKYASLLPEIRQEIGLETMSIRMSVEDGYGSEEAEEEGRVDNGKGKQAQTESASSSSSTTTEGSVLSQSVLHDDPDETQGTLGEVSDRLIDYLARIDQTLADLEENKLAFRTALINQIQNRTLAIHKHEIFLASCSERQELMRKDRELVNQMKRTVKVFGQEGRMVDHFKLAITNGISRPLISLIVSFLSKLIGLCLKLFALHSAVHSAPLRGLISSLCLRWLYTLVWRHSTDTRLLKPFLPHLPLGLPLFTSLAAWDSLLPYLGILRSLFYLARILLICINFSLILTSLSALLFSLLTPSSVTRTTTTTNSASTLPSDPDPNHLNPTHLPRNHHLFPSNSSSSPHNHPSHTFTPS